MTRKPRKREGGNFLAGIGVGVLVGLAVALGIDFYLNRTPIPFTTAKPKQPEKATASGKPPAITGLPQSAAPAPIASVEKPKFDFYRILPGSEEPVTEKEIRERLRLFHPGGVVPEPGRGRQPKGAARHPRLRLERRAGEPAR